MFEWHEFRLLVGVEPGTLDSWVAEGWLLPRRHGDTPHFNDIDVARAQLILDLGRGMGVNPEGIDVILALVDQVHGLRRTVRTLLEEQPR
jgi:chaperone modulatory protein CbpM